MQRRRENENHDFFIYFGIQFESVKIYACTVSKCLTGDFERYP